MTTIELFTVIGACAAVIAAWVGVITVRNTKGSILKRIARKNEQIRLINNEIVNRYGLQHTDGIPGYPATPLHLKKQKLQRQIAELESRL